jgi:hypothetical protein
MNACEGGYPSPLPKGASNPQTVLCHASIVSAQNWSAGDRPVCVSDANVLAEELEPLWFTAILLRVPEARLWMLSVCTQPGQQACRLAILGRTNLRCQGYISNIARPLVVTLANGDSFEFIQ